MTERAISQHVVLYISPGLAGNPATSQDRLDICAHTCNIGEIAKDSAGALTCAKVAAETALTRAHVLCP
jgi:hypothetical protein